MYGSYVPIHTTIIHQHQKAREEEEDMTRYTSEELNDDWEFKIMRSTFGSFRNPRVLQALIEEEFQAGWQMVEKFDDYRVRFKRPRSARENDINLPAYIDPYRTQYGGLGKQSSLMLGIVIVLALFVAGLVAFFLVN